MAKQLQSLQPQIFSQHLLNGSLLSPAGRIYGLLPDSGFTRMLPVVSRRARIDPDVGTTLRPATAKEMMVAIAKSEANPTLSTAVARCTADLQRWNQALVAATRGWHRTTHWLHHGKSREAVYAVVGVQLLLLADWRRKVPCYCRRHHKNHLVVQPELQPPKQHHAQCHCRCFR